MSMISSRSRKRIGTLSLTALLTACSTLPQPHDDGALQREALAGTEKPAPAPLPVGNGNPAGQPAATHAQISEGSGNFVRATGLPRPRKQAAGADAVTFNFENQPIQGVVKTILGDMLQQNYTVVPGVQGNITFSTAQPVDREQALPILETLLSWTGNALIQQGGRYVVLPAKDAVPGNIVPSLGAAAPSGGLQARLFPLHYISANEMQKLIKPFTRTDAVLLADSTRNLLILSGSPEQLDNFQRMIRQFDVDWLRGMSVGVFSLEHASVAELMPQLDKLFGAGGDAPTAGMLRFIPIQRTNALVVISTQPSYLEEVGDWIGKIDRGGGNEPQLYVYDVRNLKASELAKYLAGIYAGNSSGSADNGGKVGPGLNSSSSGEANGSSNSMGSGAGGFGNTASNCNNAGSDAIGGSNGTSSNGGSTNGNGGGLGSIGTLSNGISSSGSSSGGMLGNNNNSSGGGLNTSCDDSSNDQQYSSGDGSIRISSVDANNQLLVRARPSQWTEMEAAVRRLDTVPLQVQIETRILEVDLTGDLQFGVQWYLEGLTGSTTNSDGSVTPGQSYRHRQIALGQGGNTFNSSDAFYYSFLNSKMQVAVSALETSGVTKTLSAPSLVVRNNQVARIQVGDEVPINQTSISTIGTDNTYSSVQYLNTGVILNVQPRVNPGGLVYLNIDQQVSKPSTSSGATNPTVSQREIATQVAVQSGQTVLLGGLIQQNESTSDYGIPGLNRIPVLGRLFGSTTRSKDRTELIVLITPRVISGSEDARDATDDYMTKFQSLTPLKAQPRDATGKR